MTEQQQKQKKAYSLSAFKILVVEDYDFMSGLITSMLREFGVGHVLLASNGQEAREILMLFNGGRGVTSPIDVVITDWLMPEGDGVDLMNWIRGHQQDAIRFIPTVLCSAYTSHKVAIEGRDHGANEVLVKPVSAEKLAKRIQHVIDHPRPYIKAAGFFGPDRRRRQEPFKGEERRIRAAGEVKEFHERI